MSARAADRFALAILDRVAAHDAPFWEVEDAEWERAWDLIPIPDLDVTVIRSGDSYQVRSSDLIRLGLNLTVVLESAIGVIADLAPHVTREEAIFCIRDRLTMFLDSSSGRT